MASARVRLTLAFVGGVTASALVVTAALWRARSEAIYSDLGRSAIANATLATGILNARGGSATLVDSTLGRLLTPGVKRELDVVPGYLMVIDRIGRVLYASLDARLLADADWNALQRGMRDIPDDGPAGVLTLARDRILLVGMPVRDSTAGLARVVAGVGVNAAFTAPAQLTVTLLVIVPLLIAAAGWGAWRVLGTTFDEIERITSEVAAITDGRSLHRRLAGEDRAGAEISALVETLNAMIARLEGSFMGLRRFTADASHELKTPLAVLRADVERAMSETTAPADRLVALEEALHETTRMADLVESLLTLARADEGRFDIHREPVNLNALAQDVYETALILGEAAGVAVTFPFTDDVVIQGDRTRLRQLFLNLVTNAIKYTPPGGRVDIGLGRHATTATFAVRDTGIGIAAADVPHVFERFWRADRVRSRLSERGGFGLGLSIAQWIAQAHGGTLTVTSRLNRGSLFTVTFPLPGTTVEVVSTEPSGVLARAVAFGMHGFIDS